MDVVMKLRYEKPTRDPTLHLSGSNSDDSKVYLAKRLESLIGKSNVSDHCPVVLLCRLDVAPMKRDLYNAAQSEQSQSWNL